METQSAHDGLALRRYVEQRDPVLLQNLEAHVLAWRAARARLLDLTRLDSIREAAARHVQLSAF